LEKLGAQHLATFWIVIADKTNAMKKRVNPFMRQVFDHSIGITDDKLTTIAPTGKPRQRAA
jgi:hypothetical protein